MKSTYDTEIMTSSAIGMSLVSVNLPNWPHCAGIQQLQAHRQERSSTMSEISIYRALFPRQMLFPIIIYHYSQPVTLCPVPFSVTLLCLPVLSVVFLLQTNIQSVQLLHRNHPIYPAALLHPPMWLFGMKEATVSTSFILLSLFWLLNWKTPRYHLLLHRYPWLFYQITPCFCRSLIWGHLQAPLRQQAPL
jgi:hypothetical protein